MNITTRIDFFGLLKQSGLRVWRQLPSAMLSAVPAGFANVFGVFLWMTLPPDFRSYALVPVVGALAAFGQSGVDLYEQRKVRWARADWQLALLAMGLVSVALALASASPVPFLGYVLGAVVGLIIPLAAAYGPTRHRTGIGALRGGTILALAAPALALSLLAIWVIGAVLIIATAGTGVLVVVPIATTFSAACTKQMLIQLRVLIPERGVSPVQVT